MKDVSAEIGRIYFAHRIERVLEASGANRAIRAEAKCGHCGALFIERLSRIKSGQRVSCSCKMREAFKNYWNRKVSGLSDQARTHIAEDHELNGRSAVATKYKINPYLAGFAWMSWRSSLRATHGVGTLMRIARQFSRMSNATGQKRFGLSKAALVAVSRMAKKLSVSRTGLPPVPVVEPALDGWLIDTIKSQLIGACSLLDDPQRTGSWCSVFSRREFDPSRSTSKRHGGRANAWMYEVLASLAPATRDVIFGEDAAFFMETVARTLKFRAEYKARIIAEYRASRDAAYTSYLESYELAA